MLFSVQDSDLLSAIFSAYNDWVAEFCQEYPDRLKGIAMVNVDDVQAGIREMERCAKMGFVGAMITAYPPEHRAFDSSEYEPLWAAAQDMDIPVSLHAATNRSVMFSAASTKLSYLINMDYWVRMSLSDIILSGVFERHPKLQLERWSTSCPGYPISWSVLTTGTPKGPLGIPSTGLGRICFPATTSTATCLSASRRTQEAYRIGA